MAPFTVDTIRGLLHKTANIRNVSVIAPGNDEGPALTDLLAANAGVNISANASNITTKSPANTLYFELDNDQMEDIAEKQLGNGFLINLIDSPGHVDFSSEMTAALRVTDGALVVVDTTSGVSVQTETVLRQALIELIKPVIMINKVDRALLELQLPQEDLYQTFRSVVENINISIATYQDKNTMSSLLVSPELGTVAFGSGLHVWGFTLRQFATRYAKMFGVERNKMMSKLWGDNFFNPKTKKWSTKSSDPSGKYADRGFNMFALDPIYKIFAATMNGRKEEALTLIDKLSVTLTSEERDLTDKALLKVIMRKFLPAAEALMEMICIHLPSPVKAQNYRCDGLYEGPQDDECAASIRACDPNGPLMLYVSKMVPTSDKGRYYAFGRVFSGTVKNGRKVRIQGPNYVPGSKTDLFYTRIQHTVLMIGRYTESIEYCPAGNIVGLAGVDQYLLKSGTLTTSDTAHNLKVMKLSVSPVVQIAVDVKNQQDLPKLVEGLKRLSKSDPCVLCFTSESGEHIVAGSGELHLEICLKDLEEDHAQVPITKSGIAVEYRETVQAKSSAVMMARSPNRHSRFYLTAEPIHEELAALLDNGKISTSSSLNECARHLTDEFEWDVYDTCKIWAFGPEPSNANMLVDMTKGVQYLNEIKDSCVLGFKYTVAEGPCAGLLMRSCRFNILDIALQTDAIHRGAGQILPVMRRAIYGASLLASPGLQEPMYLVEIQCPDNTVSSVCSLILGRRGRIFSENLLSRVSLCSIKAYLPVAESFTFIDCLRVETGGKPYSQMHFSHWETMSGHANKPSAVMDICLSIRVRKGMPANIPGHDYYVEKS